MPTSFLGKCQEKIDINQEENSVIDKTLAPFIFGTYEKSAKIINGKVSYQHKNDQNYGIWWACGDRWCLNKISPFEGQCSCLAFNIIQSKCISSFDDNTWRVWINGEWRNNSFESYFRKRKALGISSLLH